MKSHIVGHYFHKERKIVDAYFQDGNVIHWQIVPDSTSKLMIFLEIKEDTDWSISIFLMIYLVSKFKKFFFEKMV